MSSLVVLRLWIDVLFPHNKLFTNENENVELIRTLHNVSLTCRELLEYCRERRFRIPSIKHLPCWINTVDAHFRVYQRFHHIQTSHSDSCKEFVQEQHYDITRRDRYVLLSNWCDLCKVYRCRSERSVASGGSCGLSTYHDCGCNDNNNNNDLDDAAHQITHFDENEHYDYVGWKSEWSREYDGCCYLLSRKFYTPGQLLSPINEIWNLFRNERGYLVHVLVHRTYLVDDKTMQNVGWHTNGQVKYQYQRFISTRTMCGEHRVWFSNGQPEFYCTFNNQGNYVGLYCKWNSVGNLEEAHNYAHDGSEIPLGFSTIQSWSEKRATVVSQRCSNRKRKRNNNN